MSRTRRRPRPDHILTLTPLADHCPACGHQLWADYDNFRTVTTLDTVLRLTLPIRRCPNSDCGRFHKPYRPEAEPHFALPHHEFGLAVLAAVGHRRYALHKSVPEIHQELTRRRVAVAPRTVTNLLDRYDALRALASADPKRRRRRRRDQGRIVLAVDGLQPDVGHEILWVLRDCLSGAVVLCRSLLSATIQDLSGLLREARDALPAPITGVIADGQDTIRQAVTQTLPGVPPQWCPFHYLREAARPIYEADRHAQKELKQRVRGVRSSERAAAGADDAEAEVVRGSGAAVRSALTDDGRPPLAAPGLQLHDRLEKIAASLEGVAAKAGTLPGGLKKLQRLLHKGLPETAARWPPVRAASRWVHRVARLLKNEAELPARPLRRRRSGILAQMRQAASQPQDAGDVGQLRHVVKVTKSWGPGLFACYQSTDLPRTNNDREHLFGSHRDHERRASGRKVASPGLVVRGAARIVAGLATRQRPEEGLQLPEG